MMAFLADFIAPIIEVLISASAVAQGKDPGGTSQALIW